jgi:rRNA small subunit pseudouridine methyltransferase Nep1
MDSPLNKADRLRVYIHTEQNVLIELHPRVRVPRTFTRFSGLFAQLLEKRRIMATNANEVLMKVIQNPITKYLPVGSRKILLTDTSERLRDIRQVAVDEVADHQDIVFAIGAISHGDIDPEWTEESMAISAYSCSAAMICSRVCHAFEGRYGIL